MEGKEEKTWHCIAWHLGNFLDDVKEERKADFARSCETCKYNNNCNFDISPFIKLLETKTDVKFSFNTDLKMTDVNP